MQGVLLLIIWSKQLNKSVYMILQKIKTKNSKICIIEFQKKKLAICFVPPAYHFLLCHCM